MVYCSTRLALSGLISLFCSNLFSQTATFQQTYGGAGYDVVNDMLETADGYLIAGETFNPTNDHTDALLIKLDKNGTVIWKKTYGQFADDGFRDIAPANDGGFIVWGALENFNLNRTDAWLVKLDDDGNLLWQKTIGETGFSEYPSGRIIAMPDGYILSGSKVNPGYYQPFILRVNNAGNTLWSQFTPSNNYSSMHAHYVVDSMLYLTGTANSLGAWRTMNISTGEIVQHREYLADSINWLYNMHRTPEGNQIMTGNITKDIPGLFRYYGWVQKADPQGQVIWSKIYNAGEVSNVTASEMLADGTCVLGLYFQPSTQVGIIHSALVKIDTAGAVVWARTFTGTPWLFINDITQTSDGGFFATGYTQNISGPTINQNAIWIKTDSLGIVDGCCVATPTIVVEDIPVTPRQEQINEATFEQTVPFQFAFADTAILPVLDFCSNVQPEISQTIQFCPGESVTLGDSTYHQPGTVTLNLPSTTGGCDTIATYTLEHKTGNACIDSTCEASFFKRLFVQGKSTQGYKIVPAPNETFFVAASADENTIIALTDKNMNVIWARSVDLAGGPDAIQDMRLDAEGYLIGVGNALTSPVQCFAFKMDPATGQLLWRSQQNSPINSYFTNILEKNDDGSGNYFLLGQTDAASGGTGCDALLMEIDRNSGALLWDKHYNLGSCEAFYDVYIENNTVYACGRYNLNNAGQAGFRAALTALDMAGNVQWSWHYLRSGAVNARLYASSLLPDNGGIMLFGYGTNSGTNLSMSTLQLMKTSPTGQLLWAKEYDIAGGTDQSAFKILNFPDGYLLAGTFVRATTTGKEIFLIKTDKAGNVLWQKSYGLNGEDRLSDIIQVADKLLLIGSAQNAQIFDMLIGKLYLDGEVDSDVPCTYIKPMTVEVRDYDPLFFSAHTLSSINVNHNYGTASLPTVAPETITSEPICLQICTDSCSGKTDATVFVDSIYCNEGRTEVRLRICNAGPAPLPANTPVTLYDANPTTGNANLLLTVSSSAVVDSGACQAIVIPDIASFFPNGGQFTLVAVANDDGSHPTPFSLDSLHNSAIEECDYSNNLAAGEFVKPASPVLNLGPDRAVCGSGALVLNAGTGFYQYTWQDGSANPAFTVLTTGIYRVEVKDFCGFVQTDSVFITVLPPVQLTEVLEFCPGESVTLGDSTYNLPGTVTLNLPSTTGGCDTIATYTLEFKTGDACGDSTCEASFIKRLFVPGQSTRGYKIVAAPNETFFVAASAGEEMVVALTDKNMNVIWARSMDMAAGVDIITDMRLDAEGQIIGVGNALVTTIQSFAFKMNPATGQLLWRSRMDSPIRCFFTKILEKNKDGSENYFLIGQTDAASGGSSCNALLLEIDRNTGAMIWDKHYNLGSCEIFDDVFIENNLIYACGDYDFHTVGQTGLRPALTVLDIDGNVQWSRHYLRSSAVDAQLYAGSMLPDNGGIIMFAHGDNSGANLLLSTLKLMKISLTGELLWVKEYDIAGGTVQSAFKIVNFPDGYLLSGSFRRGVAADQEMFLIKTDKDGNILWRRSYGRTGDDRFRDVIHVSDKLYLIGSIENGQGFDMVIGKLNLDGTVYSDGACTYVSPLTVDEKDFDTLYSSAHILSPIDVFHNYAAISLPNVSPETITSEPICLNCPDSCTGKPDATVFVDSIFCNDGRTEVRLRICNAGPAPLPANTPVTLYDANPTVGNANLLLTVLSSAAVDSGACQTIVIPDISSALPGAGSLTLAVVANDDGGHPTPFSLDSLHNTAVEECDYSNNLVVGEFVKPPSTLQLTCPKDTVVVAAAGITAVSVAYNLPNAASDCVCPGVNIDLVSGGAGGSLFPLGVSTVCYRAEDACGSEKTCCFTIRVDRESVCDTKTNGCLKFELLSVNRDAGQNWVYRIRLTNNCSAEMTYAYIQMPTGVEAMTPANNSVYTSPGGLAYIVRNPNFTPFYSLRFKPESTGLANGQSDIFRYVLPAQTKPDYIHVAARLLSGAYVEAHLNTFYCPVGTEPATKPAAEISERAAPATAAVLHVFPNPVTEGTTLTIAGGDFPDGVFVLQDLAGRLVMERRIVDNQVLPAPSGLSTGMYYFKIMENGRFAGSGKLIIQD